MAQDFGTAFLSAFVPSFQQAQNRRVNREQAEQEARLLQEREKRALLSTLLNNDNVGADTKNQLLAAIMPQFRTTTQVEKPIGPEMQQAPVTLPNMAPAAAPENVPEMSELPDKGKLPFTHMFTPAAIPTAPRGSVASVVAPGQTPTVTEEVMEPMQVFQDKAKTTEDKPDALLRDTGQAVLQMRKEGKISDAALREFLPSYQEAVRTGDFSKLKLPKEIEKQVSQPTPVEQSLIDERKQSILESKARTAKMLKETIEGDKGKPITQTAKSNFLRQMKKDAESNVSIKAYNQAARYIGLINTVVDDINTRIKSGQLAPNRIATDQFVINLWNRVQEPGSVTRIEEFRTTAQGEPIINRLTGLIEKIKSGGAGITIDSMNEIKRLANIVGGQLTKDANLDIEGYRQLTKEAIPNVSDEVLDSIARRFSDQDYTKIEGGAEELSAPGAPAVPKTGANRYKDFIRNQLK